MDSGFVLGDHPIALLILASSLVERIPLDWLRTAWGDEKNNLVQGMYLPHLPDSSGNFVTYLWNIDKKPLEISDGKMELFELR